MKKHLSLVFAAALFGSLPAMALDCGEPPMQQPPVPDGSRASADDIRDARDAVLTYSRSVDEYLTCMDQRAPVILPYLTKEQKARWDEDLTQIHNERRDLQVKLNEAIRAYRRQDS
ncbi:hypothetical protein [Kordiimonas sp.]|uniref:hypothetical protein n=1 Tax=Kordiimonas sp. TaxID=1970157 RepID=UPI003A93E364